MKYKTLFRLMLKFLGVYFCVGGFISLIGLLGNIISIYVQTIGMPGGRTTYPFMFGIGGSIVQLLAGLYLFFGGRWIADHAIPSNRPYCHECGYELTGSPGHACPECGTTFREPAVSASPDRAPNNQQSLD